MKVEKIQGAVYEVNGDGWEMYVEEELDGRFFLSTTSGGIDGGGGYYQQYAVTEALDDLTDIAQRGSKPLAYFESIEAAVLAIPVYRENNEKRRVERKALEEQWRKEADEQRFEEELAEARRRVASLEMAERWRRGEIRTKEDLYGPE